ncbi:MAG: peptidylprolyl isomerase [Anaerolineae bacterium]|nr:peptidylprolyl isomerase [Anaerolineae bacterium]
MTKVKSGDTVKVHYTGKFDDGTEFATSINDDPLQFTIGKGQVISGLEQAVMGMSPGEAKTAEILAEQAYGPYQEDKVVEVSRDRFPPHMELQIGTVLRMRKAGGEKIRRIVTTLSDTKVMLDANHPLAGEDLTFDLQLVEIT